MTVNIVIAIQFSIESGKNILHTDNYKRFRWQIELNTRKKGQDSGIRFLTLEDGADRMSRNVGKNYHYPLCNSPEECKSHAHRGGNLKSRKGEFVCKNALKTYGERRRTAPLILHLGTRRR